MDSSAVWTILTGFIVVFIVGLLTKASWKPWIKVVVVGVAAVALAFAQLAIFQQPVWSWHNVWPLATAIFTLAKVWYVGIAWRLPAVKEWLQSHGIADAASSE